MENILQFGLYSYRPSDNSTYWSEGVFKILGLEPHAIESKFENVLSYITEEDRERVQSAIRNSRKKAQVYKIEFSLIDAKGLHKRVYAENVFRKSAEGSGVYEGIIKDITENYFYKQALELKVHQLDKSNQNLQEFVYIASHDLQEPLRKISTFVGRLKSRFENVLGEEGSMYVGRILNSTGNMQTLLEDLLNFSRLSFTDKEFENVQLQQCLNSVLNDLEIKIEETQTQIIFDPLPEIEGYHTQIKQLLNNLINNAIKFRRQDVQPVIRITAELTSAENEDLPLEKKTPYVKIKIADNGIGFEPEFSEKIFMIFQRLNGRSEYAGSGVGLSICKRIVDNHGGFIFGTGEPGKGATFTVLLPLKQS